MRIETHLRTLTPLILLGLAVLCCGCTEYLIRPKPTLPDKDVTRQGQLVIYSDFEFPNRHRLLDELVSRRKDINNLFQISFSDEPIHVYLFRDEKKYRNYLKDNHPEFPDRRAFFVKTDTELKVYAFWGERVGEDLRHEVTHGYMHSSVPNLPLWLDEGAAEFFETPRGEAGFNRQHVYTLANAYRRGDWRPDLGALETLPSDAAMSQLQYAEAWLWFHFMVHDDFGTKRLIRQTVGQLKETGSASPLGAQLSEIVPDLDAELIAHLRLLAEKM